MAIQYWIIIHANASSLLQPNPSSIYHKITQVLRQIDLCKKKKIMLISVYVYNAKGNKSLKPWMHPTTWTIEMRMEIISKIVI